MYTEYGKKEVEGAYVYNENTELKGEVTITVLYTYARILYRDIIYTCAYNVHTCMNAGAGELPDKYA